MRTYATADTALGFGLRRRIESQHGAPIDWSRLEAAPRVIPMQTPYANVSDSIPNYVQNYLGPFYVVHIMSRSRTIAGVAVAAYATNLGVAADGRIVLPPIHGGEFAAVGVALGSIYSYPMVPEQAVRMVAETTGERIASVPELRSLSRLYSPTLAQWRLTTENPVDYKSKSSGEVFVTQEVYVQANGHLAVALADPLAPDSVLYPVVRADGSKEWHSVTLTIRAGFSTMFEEVTVVR